MFFAHHWHVTMQHFYFYRKFRNFFIYLLHSAPTLVMTEWTVAKILQTQFTSHFHCAKWTLHSPFHFMAAYFSLFSRRAIQSIRSVGSEAFVEDACSSADDQQEPFLPAGRGPGRRERRKGGWVLLSPFNPELWTLKDLKNNNSSLVIRGLCQLPVYTNLTKS